MRAGLISGLLVLFTSPGLAFGQGTLPLPVLGVSVDPGPARWNVTRELLDNQPVDHLIRADQTDPSLQLIVTTISSRSCSETLGAFSPAGAVRTDRPIYAPISGWYPTVVEVIDGEAMSAALCAELGESVFVAVIRSSRRLGAAAGAAFRPMLESARDQLLQKQGRTAAPLASRPATPLPPPVVAAPVPVVAAPPVTSSSSSSSSDFFSTRGRAPEANIISFGGLHVAPKGAQTSSNFLALDFTNWRLDADDDEHFGFAYDWLGRLGYGTGGMLYDINISVGLGVRFGPLALTALGGVGSASIGLHESLVDGTFKFEPDAYYVGKGRASLLFRGFDLDLTYAQVRTEIRRTDLEARLGIGSERSKFMVAVTRSHYEGYADVWMIGIGANAED